MLAIAIFVGGLSIYEVDRFVRIQTENLIIATSEKEATEINDIFTDMEKSVRIMENYVMDQISSSADIENRHKQKEIIKNTDKMFVEVAKHTNGAIAYYLRFDPKISDGVTGLFCSKAEGSDNYVYYEPTDILLYDKEDREHVGWFWEPYEAKKAIWMQPYYNQNNQILMISYVVPLYYNGQFFGVVGMDFDYTVLTDKVQDIMIYEHGFAHLELEGLVMYQDGYEMGAQAMDLSDQYLQVSKDLVNGMTLILSASYDDINQIRYDIACKIVLAVLLLAVLFSAIVIYIVKRIVHPLNKLTEASQKLAEGDYNVEIVHSDTYEIKLLSTAFEHMTVHLREHERLQHLLAYRDSMTGLRNTTAYQSWIADFEKELQNEEKNFGVIVLDVNYLKETNDRYGHDAGNTLIIGAARIIADTFKRSPVFRVGGDEFVVILQKRDLENHEKLLVRFDHECASHPVYTGGKRIPINIAKGLAIYDPSRDKQFADVFNRADEEMYKNKRTMKATPVR